MKIATLPGTKVVAATRLQQLMENHTRILDMVTVVHWSDKNGEPQGWAVTHTTISTEALVMADAVLTNYVQATLTEDFNPNFPSISPE
jgi:hypothetical protein